MDIEGLTNVSTNLYTLKSKVDELDIDKLVPISVDLNKLSVHNAKIKNIEDKIPDIITNLATKVFLNAKINEVKGGIHIITNLVTTAALTTVENKIPIVRDLVKKKEQIMIQKYQTWKIFYYF